MCVSLVLVCVCVSECVGEREQEPARDRATEGAARARERKTVWGVVGERNVLPRERRQKEGEREGGREIERGRGGGRGRGGRERDR